MVRINPMFNRFVRITGALIAVAIVALLLSDPAFASGLPW